ncbi:uncharacterized protein METZ01_LOCUS282041, partial [marine metagenome]
MMVATCLGMVAGDATAQERGGREGDDRGRRPQFGGQAGRGGFMRVLPIMTALDADRNGEISAEEI